MRAFGLLQCLFSLEGLLQSVGEPSDYFRTDTLQISLWLLKSYSISLESMVAMPSLAWEKQGPWGPLGMT